VKGDKVRYALVARAACCVAAATLALRPTPASAQDLPRGVVIVGRGSADLDILTLIMRFEIVDQDNGFPIPGAQVLFEDNLGRLLAGVASDQEGMAIVLEAEFTDLRSMAQVRVRSPRHEQWVLERQHDQISSDVDDTRLWIPNNRENWTNTYHVRSAQPYPTTSAVADAVRSGKYSSSCTSVPFRDLEYTHSCAGDISPYWLWTQRIELRRLEVAPVHALGLRERPAADAFQPRRADAVREEERRATVTSLAEGSRAIEVYPSDLGPSHWYTAAAACDNMNDFGHDDWRLPSVEELDLIVRNRGSIPGLSEAYYWSSTEVVGSDVWAVSFRSESEGLRDLVHKGTTYSIGIGTLRARCVRTAS